MFFGKFFNQFFVETAERSTEEGETKMKTTAPLNQTISFTSDFDIWLQLRFCDGKMKTQRVVKK